MIIFDCGLFARCRVNKYLVLKFLRKKGRKETLIITVDLYVFSFSTFIYYQRLLIDKIQYVIYNSDKYAKSNYIYLKLISKFHVINKLKTNRYWKYSMGYFANISGTIDSFPRSWHYSREEKLFRVLFVVALHVLIRFLAIVAGIFCR